MEVNNIVAMTQEDFNRFHAATVKMAQEATMKVIEKERSRQSVRKKEIKILKGKLSCYRQHKKSLKEEIDFTEAEKQEFRLAFLEDLMGAVSLDSDRVEQMLIAQEEKRRAMKFELTLIDRALRLYEEEVAGTDSERNDWLFVVKAYYIMEDEAKMPEIAEVVGVTERTAWRYLDKGVGVLVEYIV